MELNTLAGRAVQTLSHFINDHSKVAEPATVTSLHGILNYPQRATQTVPPHQMAMEDDAMSLPQVDANFYEAN